MREPLGHQYTVRFGLATSRSPGPRGWAFGKGLQMKPDDLRQILARRSDRSFVLPQTPHYSGHCSCDQQLERKKDKGCRAGAGYRRYCPGEVCACCGFNDMGRCWPGGRRAGIRRCGCGHSGKKLVAGWHSMVRDVESIWLWGGKDLVLESRSPVAVSRLSRAEDRDNSIKAESGSRRDTGCAQR